MTAPILTVVIPTFDRPDHLRNLVELLLPQRDARWKLVILDNHSPTPVRDLVPADVQVIRHPANIGAAGNLPRCFEVMDTDWVWMIGDDDLVDDDAIDHVLAMIAKYPDAAILNFGGHGLTDSRKEPQRFEGFDAFLAGTDSMTKALWMSSNVYSRRHYWPFIGLAYRFANTACGHFVLLMMALLNGGVFMQLPRAVCRPADLIGSGTSGNHGEYMVTVMGLVDLPLNPRQRKEFARLMQLDFLKFSRDVMQCAYHLEHKEARDEIFYAYTTRWTHWSIARRSPGLYFSAMFFRVALGTALGRALIRGAVGAKERITGRPTIRHPYVPRFFRQT